jgi:hypothetical protein
MKLTLRKPLLAATLSALSILPVSLAQAPAVPDSPQAQPMQTAAQHPALFLVGDSIIRTGTGDGEKGPWGWGYEIIPMFDAAKIHVYNDAPPTIPTAPPSPATETKPGRSNPPSPTRWRPSTPTAGTSTSTSKT